MITITYLERKKKKGSVVASKFIKCYASQDKARKEIQTAVQEMRKAEREMRKPSIEIIGVSYETKSERTFLIELGALITEVDD